MSQIFAEYNLKLEEYGSNATLFPAKSSLSNPNSLIGLFATLSNLAHEYNTLSK